VSRNWQEGFSSIYEAYEAITGESFDTWFASEE